MIGTAPRRLAMLGDSLTAGFGLRRADGLPVRLEIELDALDLPVRVHNAGISGDTIADGLRRLERDVPDDTELCLVALGANDLIRRERTEQMRAGLDAILDGLARRGIPALLCGMRAPPWLGGYAIAFDRVFADAARDRGTPLDPFLLEGVALTPGFVLPDGIHPNAAGTGAIARRLAPVVANALRALDKQDSASDRQRWINPGR